MRLAAARFDTAADLLYGQLSGLQFDGSVAGHAHVAHGDALRATMDRLAAVLAQWSRAAAEIAAALRADADRYGEAELRAVAVLQ